MVDVASVDAATFPYFKVTPTVEHYNNVVFILFREIIGALIISVNGVTEFVFPRLLNLCIIYSLKFSCIPSSLTNVTYQLIILTFRVTRALEK